MDNTHVEFVGLVNLADESSDRDFARMFGILIEHTRKHFEQEDRLMTDSAFPAIAEHRDEHQRILGELEQFRKRVDRGLLAFGRNYIRGSLAEWFPLHAATMDSALAAHLKSESAVLV
jgi:hemerythrin